MLKTIPVLALLAISTLPACIIVVDHDDVDGGSTTISGDFERGSGNEIGDVRTVEPFHRIVARDAVDVDVRIGTPQSVTVRTDDNLVSWIETSVQGGELTVRWAPRANKKSLITKGAPRVEVVVSTLDRVQIDGTGAVKVVGLDGGTLELRLGGVGALRADGKVDKLDLVSSGMGDAQLFGLEVGNADVTLSGTGNAMLNVRDRLHASITGMGDVRYRGHPKDVSKSVTGMGSIEADKN